MRAKKQKKKIDLFTPDKIAAREAFEHDPLLMGKKIAPKKFKLEYALYHPTIAQEVMNPDPKYDATQFLANRGGGKTTFFLGLLPLHSGCCLGIQNMLMGSSNEKVTSDFLEHARAIVAREEFKYYYGDCVTKSTTRELIIDQPELDIHFRIKSKSKNEVWEGILYEIDGDAIRWQRVFLDDCETEKSAGSEVKIEEFIKFMWNSLYYGRDTTHFWRGKKIKPHIFVVGTTFYPNAALMKLKRSRRVKTYVFPVIVHDKYGDKEANAFAKKEYGLRDLDSLWPGNDEFSTENMLAEWDKLKDDPIARVSWIRQRLLNPEPEGAKKFDIDKVRPFKWERLEMGRLNFYILIDAAFSRAKKADNVGIVLIGVDEYFNKMWLRVIEDKFDFHALVLEVASIIAEFHLKSYDLVLIGIETTDFDFIEELLIQEFMKHNITVPIEQLKHGNVPKKHRIAKHFPDCNNKKTWVEESHIEAWKEKALAFDIEGPPDPKGFNDFDAAAYIYDVNLVTPPSRETVVDQELSEHNQWVTEVVEGLRKQTGIDINIIQEIHNSFFPEGTGRKPARKVQYIMDDGTPIEMEGYHHDSDF
jgi:hypothetical protein